MAKHLLRAQCTYLFSLLAVVLSGVSGRDAVRLPGL